MRRICIHDMYNVHTVHHGCAMFSHCVAKLSRSFEASEDGTLLSVSLVLGAFWV